MVRLSENLTHSTKETLLFLHAHKAVYRLPQTRWTGTFVASRRVNTFMLTKERISGTFVDIYKQKEKILINLSQYLQKQVSILGEKFFVVLFPLNMHPL